MKFASPQDAANAILGGNVRAAARLMRMLDDRIDGATDVLRQLYPHTGRAKVLGITGNPGSGKSTLTARLIGHYRKLGMRVGVLAIDPSSPFSGGAILGDRIRMMEFANDPNVFIRSLATRGALGGLSRSTNDIVHVLDAMGHDIVLIETVGVGQDEIDIVRTADTTIVVLVPGLGDDIQAIKAGILEIADIFVVNKADLDGADRTVGDLRGLQTLMGEMPDWLPPIVRTVAARNEGVDALAEAVSQHADFLKTSPTSQVRAQNRAAFAIGGLVREQVWRGVDAWLRSDEAGRQLVLDVTARRVDPYLAAQTALAQTLHTNPHILA
jgi:LAO/AO transport system kinase